MTDVINPSHYKHLPVEAIDIIEAAIAEASSNEAAYLQGQVLKYLLRCWEKNGIEDLRKAKWYLDRLVGSFDDLLDEINAPILEEQGESPKRYREPTLADLANGQIKCEYRDFDGDDWVPGYLTGVIEPPCFGFRFRCHSLGAEKNWIQCQIEVQE